MPQQQVASASQRKNDDGNVNIHAGQSGGENPFMSASRVANEQLSAEKESSAKQASEAKECDDAQVSGPAEYDFSEIDAFNETGLAEEDFPNANTALSPTNRPTSSVSFHPSTRRIAPKPTNENPNFVRDYFASSRLHFIGSFRARYESMMVSVAERLNRSPAELLFAPPPLPTPSRIIVHVDMDCFFASVAMANNKELVGKPIAVCHAKGGGVGGGEVSSCSYEARKFGVRAGMFFHSAKKLCPDLIGVPYDFPAYERASIAMYARFYSVFGARVEAMSVDEAYLDVTHAAESDVNELVTRLRKSIRADTGCNASAGVGSNKLVARLATKLAKPNGQRRIESDGVEELIAKLPVGDIPGVGWRTKKRFAEMNIDTCGQLQTVPLAKLQAEFGENQGKIFFDTVRGVDERPVEPMKPRKSIGAEASWGVRFTAGAQDAAKCEKFVADMAAEVASRVLTAGALGSKVLYKAYKSKKIDGKMKYLGHGPCHILTRSTRIMERIDKNNLKELLAKTCWKIHREIGVPNDELRGVGIQLTDLVFENLKLVPHGEKTTSTIDVFLKGGAKKNLFAQQSLSGAPKVQKRPRNGLKDFFVKRPKTGQNDIPDDWDKDVFEALPKEIRTELMANQRRSAGANRSAHEGGSSSRGRGRRRNAPVNGSPARNRGVQTTMTQFARARESRGGTAGDEPGEHSDTAPSQVPPVVEVPSQESQPSTPRRGSNPSQNPTQMGDGSPLLFENDLNDRAPEAGSSCLMSWSSGSDAANYEA